MVPTCGFPVPVQVVGSVSRPWARRRLTQPSQIFEQPISLVVNCTYLLVLALPALLLWGQERLPHQDKPSPICRDFLQLAAHTHFSLLISTVALSGWIHCM